MKSVIIAGSRDVFFTPEEFDAAIGAVVQAHPYGLLWEPEAWETVICGMAKGVDLCGKAWAEARGKKVDRHPITPRMVSQWGKYLAPKMRNREMCEVADAAVFFWNGHSGGTADCCLRMVCRGKPVLGIPWKATRKKKEQ